MLGSMPRISTTSRSAPGGLATVNRVVGHSILRVLRVDGGDLAGLPHLLEVFHGRGRCVRCVVPALEGGDGHGGSEQREAVELSHADSLRAPRPHHPVAAPRPVRDTFGEMPQVWLLGRFDR
jgi:hypothetical protein